MVIYPSLEENGALLLSVYSRDEQGFDALEKTLHAAGVSILPEKLIPENLVPGFRYTVVKQDVAKLEIHLNVSFRNSENVGRTVPKFFGKQS